MPVPMAIPVLWTMICFRFIGDGPEKQMLVQQAIDLQPVSFEGPVPKAQIPALMPDLDATLRLAQAPKSVRQAMEARGRHLLRTTCFG